MFPSCSTGRRRLPQRFHHSLILISVTAEPAAGGLGAGAIGGICLVPISFLASLAGAFLWRRRRHKQGGKGKQKAKSAEVKKQGGAKAENKKKEAKPPAGADKAAAAKKSAPSAPPGKAKPEQAKKKTPSEQPAAPPELPLAERRKRGVEQWFKQMEENQVLASRSAQVRRRGFCASFQDPKMKLQGKKRDMSMFDPVKTAKEMPKKNPRVFSVSGRGREGGGTQQSTS